MFRQFLTLQLFHLLAMSVAFAEVQVNQNLDFKLDLELLCRGNNQVSTKFADTLEQDQVFRAIDRGQNEKNRSYPPLKALLIRGALVTQKSPDFFLDASAYTAAWFKISHPGVETYTNDPASMDYKVTRFYNNENGWKVVYGKVTGYDKFNFNHHVEKYTNEGGVFKGGQYSSWAQATANGFLAYGHDQNLPVAGAVFQFSDHFNYPFASEGNFLTAHPIDCNGNAKTLLIIHRIIWINKLAPLGWKTQEEAISLDIHKKLEGLTRTLEKVP